MLETSNTNNTIQGNNCEGGYHGIYLYALNVENVVSENTCIDNTQFGIYIELANDDNNVRHGILLIWESDNNTLTGNSCIDNDSGDTTTYSGIAIDGDSNSNVLSGNRCEGNDDYGIDIQNADCNDNHLVGNNLMGNTTGGLNDSGTATIRTSNLVASGVIVDAIAAAGAPYPVTENHTGADCDGVDGAANRNLTLANAALTTIVWATAGEGINPFPNGFTLQEGGGLDFTVVHNAANTVVTFLVNVFDANKIVIRYWT